MCVLAVAVVSEVDAFSGAEADVVDAVGVAVCGVAAGTKLGRPPSVALPMLSPDPVLAVDVVTDPVAVTVVSVIPVLGDVLD